MDIAQFDNILLGILQKCEQIEPFLETVFCFLARRTDFFRLMQSKDQKYGFPPGVAEAMVMKIFKRYQKLVLENEAEKVEKKKKKNEERQKLDEGKDNAVVMADDENNKEINMNVDNSTEVKKIDEDLPTPVLNVPTQEDRNSEHLSASVPYVESTVEVKTQDSEDSKGDKPNTDVTNKVAEQNITLSQDEASTSHSSNQQESEEELKGLRPGTTPESYNGAILDNYTWSQSVKDIDVRVPLPTLITKARDVGVEIKSDHLKVFIKKNVAVEELKMGSKILVDGRLQRKIRCEESMWSLEPGKCVVINLEKYEERFWTAVIEGDPEIDKTKVDTTRCITDFDEQTQCDYERVMFDHHQKLQGKPTSQEKNAHEMLKKAWDAKGSPFAGTPFDPSKVNISPGSGF